MRSKRPSAATMIAAGARRSLGLSDPHPARAKTERAGVDHLAADPAAGSRPRQDVQAVFPDAEHGLLRRRRSDPEPAAGKARSSTAWRRRVAVCRLMAKLVPSVRSMSQASSVTSKRRIAAGKGGT